MSSKTTMLHVRVDSDTKLLATQMLSEMGLSMSDAVRVLLHRVIAEQAFPLELKVPNAETRAAIKEAQAMLKSRGTRHVDTDALFDDLEKQSR